MGTRSTCETDADTSAGAGGLKADPDAGAGGLGADAGAGAGGVGAGLCTGLVGCASTRECGLLARPSSSLIRCDTALSLAAELLLMLATELAVDGMRAGSGSVAAASFPG